MLQFLRFSLIAIAVSSLIFAAGCKDDTAPVNSTNDTGTQLDSQTQDATETAEEEPEQEEGLELEDFAELEEEQELPPLEQDNPLQEIPAPPLGLNKNYWQRLAEDPPTPERVRLGRWLFYDKRLSVDKTISCATCHKPENAFSEPTPVSTGIDGQKGDRKAPTFINAVWALSDHFFWDGRAASLEEQALGPIENPIEMGNTVDKAVETISNIPGYRKYFAEAFGDDKVTAERIAKAIADYERTRMSGNSPRDLWKDGDESAVSEKAKKGDEIFHNKAQCNQCHLGDNFTDGKFHNIGVGWDPEKKGFKDLGRFEISKEEVDKGAFKTPTLRDVTKHAPYMHDGSVKTLREVIDLYNRGGEANPYLSPKIKALKLTEEEIEALLAFLESLDGQGYLDTAPTMFPE